MSMDRQKQLTLASGRVYRDPYEDFERFATDHRAHVHCRGCGGCLLDPAWYVQSYPSHVWCIACRDRIKATCEKSGAPLPWDGGWEIQK